MTSQRQDPASVGWENLDDLYREIILDHYRNPRSRRPLSQADITAEGQNPFCGDEIQLQARLENGRIAEVGVLGHGCAISQASASIMSELLKGKTLEEAQALVERFKKMMHGTQLSEAESEELGELEALSGVRNFPIRIKCALLPWTTLEEGVETYRAKTGEG